VAIQGFRLANLTNLFLQQIGKYERQSVPDSHIRMGGDLDLGGLGTLPLKFEAGDCPW